MHHKTWQFRGSDAPSLSPEFLDAVGNSQLLARLLYNRGIQSPADAKAFLELENYSPTSGWELPDMDLAVPRVLKAIEAQEPILIYGDFDVDGITGTSVLYQTLKFLGAAVTYYIPDRATEGHGLHVAALCRLVSTRHVKLVITTDTGITNFSEVSLLNGLKVDTIVTDHHGLPENLPPAVANVNPQRLEDPNHPLAFLAGVGVAYKLCELLLEAKEAPASFAESLLDLVAIGTVADLATLHRENRYLVYRGVQVMNQRQRLGINEILTEAGTKPDAKLSSETVGFTIGPRLNALGRLDNATEAVELLTTQDTERARVIAAHLEYLNRRRQELCEKTMLEAEKYLLSNGGLEGRKAIILASPDWNLGVIGIVASRLIDKYHVPVFLMVIDEAKGEARCSARSIPGFHLHEALTELEHYFTHFGGHSGAGGFGLKLEKLDAFKQELYALTERRVSEKMMQPLVDVDTKLEWNQLTTGLIELTSRLAPFGKENPAPRFVLEHATVAAQRPLGAEGRHVKLILAGDDPKKPIEALFWNAGTQHRFENNNLYHFVVSAELNTFNNTTKVQLIIDDYRPAKSVQTASYASAPPKVIPLQPVPEEKAIPEVSSGPRWVDHRSRSSIESFMSQLMLPTQAGQSLAFYHEGRKPEIPFLSEEIICHRQALKPAETLILWDLPPDLATFQQVVSQVQPTLIHLVGGKYQSVPVFPVVRSFLKVIYQTLARQLSVQKASQSADQPMRVQFDSLAAQLSSTPMVMTQGLVLLNKLGLVTVVEAGTEEASVTIAATPPPTEEAFLQQSIEYIAFQQSLKEVGRFRDWVLQAPLDKIKSSVILVPYAPTQREEVTPDGTSRHLNPRESQLESPIGLG